jgi:hypothetical protein
VVRKERSRGFHIAPSLSSIASLVRSSLSHHIGSVRLIGGTGSKVHFNRATLHQLRMLPQLTKFDLAVVTEEAAAALLQGASSASAAELMQAALPTSLRSFSFTICPSADRRTPSAQSAALGATLLTAAASMPHLIELRICHGASWDNMRLDVLAESPQLRTLTLDGSSRHEEVPHVAGLKQLAQLRALTLERVPSELLVSLCQPPHSLQQLEALTVRLGLGETEMRALLHLPTLTSLEAGALRPLAWSLLSQLPHLRRLTLSHHTALTNEHTTILTEALVRCAVLEDLSLSLSFSQAMSEEVQRTCWSLLLSRLPHLRRLGVNTENVAPFLVVLPTRLPRLEQLVLHWWACSALDLTQLAHPTLQHLELDAECDMTEEQMHALLHTPRLPQLRSCKSRPSTK